MDARGVDIFETMRFDRIRKIVYTLNFVRSGVNISKIAIFLEKLREGDLWDKFFGISTREYL